jgi:hypothetical protein
MRGYIIEGEENLKENTLQNTIKDGLAHHKKMSFLCMRYK